MTDLNDGVQTYPGETLEAMRLTEKMVWEQAMGMVVDWMGDDRRMYTRDNAQELVSTMLDRYTEVAGFVIGEVQE